jgi:hypothetical protein
VHWVEVSTDQVIGAVLAFVGAGGDRFDLAATSCIWASTITTAMQLKKSVSADALTIHSSEAPS